MPNMDKTGPRGEGPMTGGCRGKCDGEKTGRSGFGRRGRGCGRGLGLKRRGDVASNEDKA